MMNIFRKSFQKKKNMSDQEIYGLLTQFTDSSLEMPVRRVRGLFDDTRCFPLVFGYFLGAMDYIIEYKNLDSTHARKLFKSYLSFNFTNDDRQKAKEMYQMFKDLSQTPEGRQNMLVGRNTFKQWLENQVEIIPDLNRLLFTAQVKQGMF